MTGMELFMVGAKVVISCGWLYAIICFVDYLCTPCRILRDTKGGSDD